LKSEIMDPMFIELMTKILSFGEKYGITRSQTTKPAIIPAG